jgi:hypothetical protein
MAAKCVEDLKAAVDAVKADYGNDPKWAEAISKSEDALKAAESAESPAPESPGQKAASQVHDESKETPQSEKAETPAEQKQEQDSGTEQHLNENPKDMKGAAKIALLMLRSKK